MKKSEFSEEILTCTSEIVSAYLAHNIVEREDVSSFVTEVYSTLCDLVDGEAVSEGQVLHPAVAIEESVKPDYLICLEDGKQLKMLKRHLRTAYDMSPDEYRQRWGLDADYPMVAPNYAKQRSKLAKDIGLGKR